VALVAASIAISSCSTDAGKPASSVKGPPSADTSGSAGYVEESSHVYSSVLDALTVHWPQSDDEHFKTLAEIGLKQEMRNFWAYRADPAGVTSVNGGPTTLLSVRYEPKGTPTLAPEVIASLRGSAKSVQFYAPDILDFTSHEIRGQLDIENTVEVRLPSGSWMYTMSTFSRSGSRR
jgi:hypothetical protein